MTVPRTIRPREGEQPGTPFEGFEAGTHLGPLEFAIDAEVAESYRELHGGDADWYRDAGGEVGPLVPPTVLALYLMPLLYRRYPPLQGIVLMQQRFAFHRPLRAAEPLTATGRIEDTYERRGRHFVRWRAEFRTADGGLASEATNTFMLPEES